MMNETKIDEINPALAARLKSMSRARDFLEGSDALRRHDLAAAGELRAPIDVRDRQPLGNGGAGGAWGDPVAAYIPRLSEKQSYNDYCTYLMGALYPNYLEKTREDFRGLIFSRAPVMELPAAVRYMLEDCDSRGTPLDEELEAIVDELYAVSRYGWWIDMPEVPEGLNQAQAETMALRPFIVPYRSEEIVNWSYDYVGNRIVLVRVVLKDSPSSYRELWLDRDADPDTGSEIRTYRTRVWEKPAAAGKGPGIVEAIGRALGHGGSGAAFVPGPIETPAMDGAPISEIPFYFFSPFGGRAEPGKPMLDDLVMVAWSLYRSSALLEHSRFTCGLATAIATGFDPDTEFMLGGLNVIAATNVEATFQWAERKGDDCLPLERAVEQKTKMLVQMGSKALEEAKKAAESAESLRLRSSGDTATCADIAQAVSRIASQALDFCARWMGDQSPKAVIKLTTDYAENVADPAEITALDKSVTAGNLPKTDYFARLRKTGVIEADRTDAMIEADLERDRAASDDAAGDALVKTAAKLVTQGGAA